MKDFEEVLKFPPHAVDPEDSERRIWLNIHIGTVCVLVSNSGMKGMK